MPLNELPDKIDSVFVEINDRQTGIITKTSHHTYMPFDENVNVCLSHINQPNKMAGINNGSLHPIFAQNLPEGFNRKYISQKLARYAKVDDLYLLALQGDNGIGMLDYKSDLKLEPAEDISINDIVKYNSQEPLFPQLLEKYYLRNSLAGMQPKVAINTKEHTERTIQQKNVIVKSFDEELPLLTVNEFVCMEAARHCGLQPPRTYLSENLEHFIIERFDRIQDEDGSVCRLGYEDFTTVLGKASSEDAKYKGKYETLLKATALFTRSDSEIETMYRYIVFNCLIGNGDAHLKNFALQYDNQMENVFVSPIFDVTHTIIYENIDNKMALKLKNSKEFPCKKDLMDIAFGEQHSIRNAEDIIESTAQCILDYLARSNEVQLMKGLRESIEASVAHAMGSTYSTKSYRHDRILKHK